MLTYISSRISSGNTLFPDKLEIDAVNVTYYKGHLTGYQSTIIARSNIASVYIGTGLLFADIIIETIGGKRVTVTGFKKNDAKSVVAYLSLNNKNETNVYVNTNASSEQFNEQNTPQSLPIKTNAEKEILVLSEKIAVLTLKQIILNTNLEIEEAENAIKNLINKGMAKEDVDSNGKTIYRFGNQIFNLVLKSYDPSKEFQTIIYINGITGLKDKDIKNLIKSNPCFIKLKNGIPYDEALKICDFFRSINCVLELG